MWPDDFGFPNGGPEHPPEHPEEELAAFVLNALDGPEFQAVAQHVVRCFHCQEVLVGFQEMAARLASAAPETPLPPDLKTRVLSTATRPPNSVPTRAALPPADPRWSLRRLRRWLAPVVIGGLSLLLAGAVGIIWEQQREIEHITAASKVTTEQIIAASTSATTESLVNALQSGAIADRKVAEARLAGEGAVEEQSAPVPSPAGNSTPAEQASARTAAGLSGGTGVTRNDSTSDGAISAGETAEKVDLVRREMSDVVEAAMMAVHPETEKLPMNSPMGTEPEAKGVLIVEPNGQHAVLMVKGMPADSYQVWLMRADKQTLVGRIVVNHDDGNSVMPFEMNESIFDFQEVALMPDERHGPTTPNGEKFLTARIIGGPPIPPNVNR